MTAGQFFPHLTGRQRMRHFACAVLTVAAAILLTTDARSDATGIVGKQLSPSGYALDVLGVSSPGGVVGSYSFGDTADYPPMNVTEVVAPSGANSVWCLSGTPSGPGNAYILFVQLASSSVSLVSSSDDCATFEANWAAYEPNTDIWSMLSVGDSGWGGAHLSIPFTGTFKTF